jgi:hypothetical protein
LIKEQKYIQQTLNYLEKCGYDFAMNGYSTKPLKLPFDLLPIDFLKFAENDLNHSDKKSLVNSLGNTKRAIDCRVDSLLFSFSLYNLAKKENWSFPKKIDLLTQLEIVAPRILKKINQKRNKLEHEFQYPSKDDVEDALDVATMFIHYTEKYVEATYNDTELTMHSHEEIQPLLNVKFDVKKGVFKIQLYNTNPVEIKCRIKVDDRANFIAFLKYWAKAIRLK